MGFSGVNGFVAFVACAVYFLHSPSYLSGDDASTKQPKPFRCKSTVKIERTSHGGAYPVEVGEIPTGRLVDLQIEILNQTNERLNYDQATVSCSCLKAEIPKGLIEPGTSKTCHVLIDTKKRQSSHRLQVLIRLADSEKKTNDITLSINGYLTGFLGFKNEFNVAEFPKDKSSGEFEVLFFATAPIVGDLVNAEHNPAIGEISLEKASGTQDLWKLKLFCNATAIPNEGVVTRLKLEHLETGRVAECSLLISTEQQVKLSPHYLRLQQTSDELHEGSSILTIREDENDSNTLKKGGTKESVPPLPVVSATIGGKPLKLSLKRLNREHIRVSASISRKAVEQLREREDFEDIRVNWTLSTHRGARQISAPIVFIDAN